MSAQKAKEKEEDKLFMLEFIECYRSLPALWDAKSKHYADRQKKEEHYETLLEKYRERYPEADRKEMNRRINILRSNLKREAKRLRTLNKSGSGGGVSDDKETRLWYYDALSFIQDIDIPRTTRSLDNKMNRPERMKQKKELSATQEMVHLVLERLKEPKSDQFQKASEVWALKLQQMESHQALLAEKIINDALFQGQLGQLTIDSIITNTSYSPIPITTTISRNLQYESSMDSLT